jgi:hypothetical protein
MKLLDIANELKQQAEATRKAAEEDQRIATARSRRISYYEQFGDQWFGELAKQIDIYINSFSEIAGDAAKLNAELKNGSNGCCSIAVCLVAQPKPSIELPPHLFLRQEHNELKVLLELFDGLNTEFFEYEVKIQDYTTFKVRVVLKTEKTIIDDDATDRFCKIDDPHFFPIFKTVKSEEAKTLSTSEFAEFSLAQFIEAARKSDQI